MNEKELEELAIKELLKEAEVYSQNPPILEVQSNKSKRSNKEFLGRTLNSVITHNKRINERTQKKCRDKLKELEDRRYQRLNNFNNSWDSEDESIRACSSNNIKSSESDNKVKKKKKTRSIERIKKNVKSRHSLTKQIKEMYDQRQQYEREEYYAKHFDKLAAFALASESYHLVGKWLCYQALLTGSYEAYEQHYEAPCDAFQLSGIETLEPFDSTDVINLSSDEDIMEELQLGPFHMDDCISLDSDSDDTAENKTAPTDALECQLIDDELDILSNCDEEVMPTIELSDSSDNNEQTEQLKCSYSSIDLTSD